MLNRIFQLPKFIATKLSRKILFPILIVGLLVLVSFFVFNYQTNAADNQIRQAENSRLAEQFFNLKLHDLNDFALGLAVQSANNPDIQAAFAAQDREKLKELTLDSYNALKEQYDIAQYQFHLAPATSFLRLHSPDKFGDDLSTFRFTIVQVNETQQPVYGLEVGRGGAGIRGATPVFYEGKHIGSVEFGLNFDAALLNSLKADYGDDWRIILTRDALSLATLDDISALKEGPTPDTLVLASTIDAIFPSSDVYNKVIAGERLISPVNEQDKFYSVTSIPLRDYSGKIIGVVDIIIDNTALVQEQTNRTILLLVVLAFVLVIGSYIILTTINQSLKPLGVLTTAANKIERGDLSQKVALNSEDEIGQLGNAFNLMTGQLSGLIASLEQRVEDRTKALRTSTEVSRRLSSILDKGKLAIEVVQQLQDAFHYYHAHIYLLDAKGETLVMTGGTGEAGKKLLERGHSIPRGRGLVGRAAESKEVVLVSNTRSDPNWLPNPLLPETQSEVAIPILAAGQVLGVLDVQNNVVGSLTEEDASLLRSIADQTAIALQNISATEETQKLAKDYKELVENSPAAIAVLDAETGVFTEANQNALELYDITRDDLNKIGPIQLSPALQPDGQGSTEKAQALISQAMEKGGMIFEWTHQTRSGRKFLAEIRLVRVTGSGDRPMLNAVMTDITEQRRLEETNRKRATQQEALNRITQKIQNATSVESALKITARELGHALGMKTTLVKINPEVPEKDKGN